MKNIFFFFFFCGLFICVCFHTTTNAQLEDKQSRENCKNLTFIKSQPLKYWINQIEQYPSILPMCAVDVVGTLGADAVEAVPALAKLISNNDQNLRIKVFEALVNIAEGDHSNPAAKVLIQILAEGKPDQVSELYALEGLAKIYKNRWLLGWTPLPGWVGVYPSENRRLYKWENPKVSVDKKSYSQSIYSGATGNATSWNTTETLARDPSFAQKYSNETLRKQADPPRIYYAGKRKALYWNLTTNNESPFGHSTKMKNVRSRTVVLLSNDKVWISEYSATFINFQPRAEPLEAEPSEIKFSDEQMTFFDRAEEALDNPPRTDFRRTIELFKPLKKGMTQFDAEAYIGEPDQTFIVGDGMTIAVYQLLDESTIVLRYSPPTKTEKSLPFSGFWNLVYATRTMKTNEPTEEFIK